MIKKLLGILLLGLMFSFNVLAGERKVVESNETEAWKVDDNFVVPECPKHMLQDYMQVLTKVIKL